MLAPLVLLVLPLSCIVAMVAFMLLRRWRRGRWLQYRDALRREALEQLPDLLAGEPISAAQLASRDKRETLERLLLDRLEVATGEEAARLRTLLESAGFLDRHLDWLRRGKHWQKLQSAALLGRAGAKLAVPMLLRMLRDPSPELRNAAARALAAIGHPQAASALLQLATEPSPPVHATMWLRMAVACRIPSAKLITLLHDDRAQVRAMAARALCELPDPPSFEQVDEWVFDSDDEVRAQMARVLGRTADARAAPLLAALARDSQWFVRLRALSAMGESNLLECLDAVLCGTRDSHFQVRARAALTLARLAARPLPVLRYLVNAGDRYALEAYLSLLGRSGMLWRTIALLRSPQPEERDEASALLGAALGAGATHEFLYALEAHPHAGVRLEIARLLARYGATALVPALEEIQARTAARRQQRILAWVKRKLLESEAAKKEPVESPATPASPGAAARPHAMADRV